MYLAFRNDAEHYESKSQIYQPLNEIQTKLAGLTLKGTELART